MLWIISYINKPLTENINAIRRRVQQSHRDYVKSRKGILVLCGPKQSDDGTEIIGALFIINVNSRSEAQAFADGEPYTHAGLRKSVTITRMRVAQLNPEVMKDEYVAVPEVCGHS